MRQTSFAAMQCSLARSLEVVGDWWTPLILRDLYLGLDRFDQLVDDLGISRNLLADRLETLTAGGVVAKEAYQERPARYRYVLTDAGRELVPVLLALTAWGDRWATPDGGPPLLLRHTGCGARTTPTVCCSECRAPLAADEVAVAAGPGGRTAPGTALLEGVLGRGPRPGTMGA
ncbi:winged helix-turn-helix transcriptional regulator [Blastococcus sp. PRF04-17]|uniref:winged helix-turn-helix transcriptional regulator n=1 Tax=Blastococcus sp. PRF04-17 TaxID=2933797 RepID=UPI001FF1F1E8|nr:helix-turn-helix domain-containing protein [Blastococcus sp. PRF04-17]UOY02065.1 helix-turn-helix transcriptional regulator [Blastococcus sp. PRF04-17]